MNKEEFAKKYPRLLRWLDEDGYGGLPTSDEDYTEVDIAVTEDLKEFQGKHEEPRMWEVQFEDGHLERVAAGTAGDALENIVGWYADKIVSISRGK